MSGLGGGLTVKEAGIKRLETAYRASENKKASQPLGSPNGDGGIRTHVPVARQLDFESSSLWPLRYVSIPEYSTIKFSLMQLLIYNECSTPTFIFFKKILAEF